jgi:hypothetical protein
MAGQFDGKVVFITGAAPCAVSPAATSLVSRCPSMRDLPPSSALSVSRPGRDRRHSVEVC